MKTGVTAIGFILLAMLVTTLAQPSLVRAAVCSVSTVPSVATVAPGGTFDVHIQVSTDTQTRGMQFVLNWDPSKVQCNSFDAGTFYSAFVNATSGASLYLNPSTPQIDNTAGTFPKNLAPDGGFPTREAIAILGGPSLSGPSGTGDVYVLHMAAKTGASGTVSFTLSNVLLGDNTADVNNMNPTVNIGQVNVVPAPTITGVSPSSGGNGLVVTISGSGFVSGSTTVKFNGTPSSSVSVSSDSNLTATVPDLGANNLNNVPVTATTSGGTSSAYSGFNYVVPQVPTILSISPNLAGPGATVTITGANFTSGATVKFNTFPGGSVSVVSGTSLTAIVPNLGTSDLGFVSVTVTTSAGTSNPNTGFNYTAPQVPTIAVIAPLSGGPGTFVTITGTNFVSGSTIVNFNATAASAVSVTSSTTLTMIVPNLGNANINSLPITVTTLGGTSAANTSFNYNVSLTPTISSIFPAMGGFGTAVAITGTNFVSGSTSVKFNTTNASNLSVIDSQHLIISVPNLGTSNINGATITINTPNGSVTTSFNYVAGVTRSAFRFMIAAGFSQSIGLKAGGTVFGVGDNRFTQCSVSSWTSVVQVASGGFHTVGLKADGTVIATGDDRLGQCNTSFWTGITQLSAGYEHTVGLRSDGTVVATGDDTFGECDVNSWTGIVQVSAGYYYTVGLKSDGTVVAVGDNTDGQYTNIGSWTEITQVSAGDHTVGLKSDGTVIATGWNGDGRCNVDSWTEIVQVSAGYAHTVGLKSDGTAVAVGDNSYGQCNVAAWTRLTQISSGGYFTIGLESDGTIVSTGQNRLGQCNTSSWNLRTMPTSMTLTSSPSTSVLNQLATFTVTVTPSPDGGQIQFQDNGINLGSPLAIDGSGQVIYTTSNLSVGMHAITAVYMGDADFASSSSTVTQTVNSPQWDVNGDHVCNVLDLILVGKYIGQTGTPGWIPEDVMHDGVINVLSLIYVGIHLGLTW